MGCSRQTPPIHVLLERNSWARVGRGGSKSTTGKSGLKQGKGNFSLKILHSGSLMTKTVIIHVIVARKTKVTRLCHH